jgi:hypothetical protein
MNDLTERALQHRDHPMWCDPEFYETWTCVIGTLPTGSRHDHRTAPTAGSSRDQRGARPGPPRKDSASTSSL